MELKDASEAPRPPRWPLPALIVTGLVPAVGLFMLGPLADPAASQNALRILVTVLSILTGFLIATITMLGDPASLLMGSWRVANAQTNKIRHVLNRLSALFYIYLLGILCALLGAMSAGYVSKHLHATISHAALCLGVAALIWSFGLPVAIRGELLRRLRQQTDDRRAKRRMEPLPPVTKD